MVPRVTTNSSIISWQERKKIINLSYPKGTPTCLILLLRKFHEKMHWPLNINMIQQYQEYINQLWIVLKHQSKIIIIKQTYYYWIFNTLIELNSKNVHFLKLSPNFLNLHHISLIHTFFVSRIGVYLVSI